MLFSNRVSGVEHQRKAKEIKRILTQTQIYVPVNAIEREREWGVCVCGQRVSVS